MTGKISLWIPSPMERKCLEHLDAPNSWSILRSERPERQQVLSWYPFRRIFLFNFVLFGSILCAFFFLLEAASGTPIGGIKEDLPYGLTIALGLAAGMALYVMHLYRRSWNGRAKNLNRAL